MVNAYTCGFAGVLLAIGLIYVKFFRAVYCRSKVSLKGKTVIVTGGNTGLGKATAVDLARRGARVILACRNPMKAAAAVKDIRKRSSNPDVVFRQLDMADRNSITSFAEMIMEEESRLDVLVNNAGIAFGIPGETVEGYDIIMWVNHFAPFLLTHLLLDKLKQSAPSRIVTVSSSAHTSIKNPDELFYMRQKTAPPGTRMLKTYGQTKVGNILFMRELGRRLEGTGVTTYSLHPGYVHTNVIKNNIEAANGPKRWLFILASVVLWPFMIPPDAGAQTSVFCAVDESVGSVTGRYYTGCRIAKESSLAQDDGVAKKLYDLSMKVTGLEK